MAIPEPVRVLALYPFRELPVPPDIEVFELEGARLGVNGWPTAQVVQPVDGGPADVRATVEEARSIARSRRKTTLAWWVAPADDHLVAPLEALGLENRDTPGLETVENAMALVDPPPPTAEDVEVRMVETWEDYRAGAEVGRAAFGMPEIAEELLRERFESYSRPDNPGRGFVALVDGRVVGNAFAAGGDVGVNLFGGAVIEEARGRGVYRSLLRARWDFAVARGTPALTVQAGRMSKPICERSGFVFVAAARVFVDEIA